MLDRPKLAGASLMLVALAGCGDDQSSFDVSRQVGPEDFVRRALENFERAVDDYLLGDKPFEAKLNPAYAPYGDYDQLMRLEEWYGRERSA